MQTLFSTLYGSRLYGTQTPTSDLDLKHITLPKLDALLLGHGVKNSVKKTNTEKNTRNGADDVDEEFIPLQVFARDFMQGQTYALELAFAIDGAHANQTFFDTRGPVTTVPGFGIAVRVRDRNFEEWDNEVPHIITFIQELRAKFLTSNIKAMMGYVVNQASLYSFKGERLNVTRELLELVKDFGVELDASAASTDDFALAYAPELIALTAKYPKYFKLAEYDIGGGRMRSCFVILEKTLPFTNTLQQTEKVLSTLISKYGSRADQASESNVDWKATMHALRIVDEGLQLLVTKHLSFPFDSEYVAKLLSIKRGEVPLAVVTEELTAKLDLLKEYERTTTLPPYTQAMQAEFDVWLAAWMRKFYNL